MSLNIVSFIGRREVVWHKLRTEIASLVMHEEAAETLS